MSNDADLVFINGINGADGNYLLPPLKPEEIATIAKGEQIDPELREDIKSRLNFGSGVDFATAAGIDPRNLADTGWGVIFSSNPKPGVKAALQELLDWRREQAGERYRECTGHLAYRPHESKQQFLERHGVGPGPVDPKTKKLPYYLLLVGDPEEIPYRFQYQLDVQFAVGRIYFDTLEEYAQYAHSVVTAEKNRLALPRRAAFFGVKNPNDGATNLSADNLVAPLAEWARGEYAGQNWAVESVLAEAATKARLGGLLGGADTPALLFTASHGMGFPNGDARQLPHQGALLCQDWTGPRQWQGSIPQDLYFAGDDINESSRLYGLVAFFFACYGAGTPKLDDFAHQATGRPPQIAPHAFVAELPRKMLCHPKGGALAVIGHVERAWGYSFVWQQTGKQLASFESTLRELLDGSPIGLALEYFNQRYAELSSDLSVELEDIKYGKTMEPGLLAGMWTANNDARSYTIIGDPAVRLAVGADSAAVAERPTIEPVVLRSSAQPQTAPVAPAAIEAAAPTSAGPPAEPPPGAPAADGTPAAPASPPAAAPAEPPSSTTVTLRLEITRSTEVPSFALPADMAAQSFGLSDTLSDIRNRLMDTIQQFSNKIGQSLENTVKDLAELKVTTYVSDKMDTITYGADRPEDLFAGARLRAVTLVNVEGDTKILIPASESQIDQNLWAIHAEMVQRAQANRAELLKMAISAATGLFETLKKP